MIISDPIAHNLDRWDEISKKREISSFPIERISFQNMFDSNDRILDYGCGKGRLMSHLKEMGFKNVAGCEPVRSLASIANNIHSNVQFMDDPRRLLYDRGSFDVIVLIAVLSSIVPLDERLALVRRIHRILSPGDHILIGDFGKSDEAIYTQRYREYNHVDKFTFKTEDGILIHHFDEPEFAYLFNGLFEIASFETFDATSIHGRRLSAHVVLGKCI